MNIIELYDQLTTNWERARANIMSHLVAIGLLLLVGFTPPLPKIDLAAIQAHPAYSMLQGIGLFALVSFGIAVGILLYGEVLRKVGQFVATGLLALFPPAVSFSRMWKFVQKGALFTIAATFEGGKYQVRDLEKRVFELADIYAASRRVELRQLLDSYQQTPRDAAIHLQNATVFVVAWIFAWWFVPQTSPLAVSIDIVFWPGLLVLVLYLLVARRWFVLNYHFGLRHLTLAVAQLVKGDDSYSERLAAARSNPKPYQKFVDHFLDEQEESDFGPSLLAYLKTRLGWQTTNKDRKRTTEISTLRKLRRFGWDEKVNRNYSDPLWLFRYASWRVVTTLDRLWRLARRALIRLGLWKL